MGMESVIYGFIQGPHWPHAEESDDDASVELNHIQLKYREIDRKLRDKIRQNLAALEALPEEDTWPFLSRQMFASPPVTNSIQHTYKSQIIHFGASFKEVETSWEEWLTKFETLLRKMYWDEVHLHLMSEALNFSSFHYTWEDADDALAIYPDTPNPVTHWTFSGGPRSFDDWHASEIP